MQLNISRSINQEKLDYAIKQIGKQEIAYLVMSSETKHDLAICYSAGIPKVINYMTHEDNYYAIYDDQIPIAICEKLPYGTVDIVENIEARIE